MAITAPTRYSFPSYGLQVLLCIMTSLLPLASHAERKTIDQVVAVVNEGVILASQLNERLNMADRQIREKGLPAPPRNILRQQVLERLIVESLQLQLAERVGLKIPSEELDAALQSIARQNGLDAETFRSKLESSGIRYDEFRRSIEQEMTLQRIQQAAVSKRIDISEQDVTNFLNSEEGKQSRLIQYRASHIVLPADSSDLAKTLVAQARNTDGFEARPFAELAKTHSIAPDAAQSGDLGWRSEADLPTLYASTIPKMKAGEISEPFFAGDAWHIVFLRETRGNETQWVEQTHARHILVKPSVIRTDEEAKALLIDIRSKILAGADFHELAKKYSEDYGSALKGGDLGWSNPGSFVPVFEKTMSSLAILEISMPFQSEFGWHILQVIERRTENMTDEMLRQSAKSFLMKRRFEDELPVWLKEIRSEAYVDIKDIAP